MPVADERRIEVVANGLPLWHGSPLALDATIVPPLTRKATQAAQPMLLPGACVKALNPNSAVPDDAGDWRQVQH